jgi:hypothetical protein
MKKLIGAQLKDVVKDKKAEKSKDKAGRSHARNSRAGKDVSKAQNTSKQSPAVIDASMYGR